MVEILRSLSEEGLLGLDGRAAGVVFSELPGPFREVVTRRLRYLPAETLSLLRPRSGPR